MDSLTATIRALFGFFYPIENLSYTGELGYYQQHEWRIIANVVHLGTPVTTAPSAEDVERLKCIDGDFFMREIQFPSGMQTRVSGSQYLRTYGGKRISETIRGVYCPGVVVAEVRDMLAQRGLSIQVVAIESVA